MKVRFLVGLLTLAGAVTAPPYHAFAEKMVHVMPTNLVFAPGERSKTMYLTNRSGKDKVYEIFFTDIIMQDGASRKKVETFPYSAKRMLRYVPRRITVKSGQRQTVRIMTRRRPDLEDGDYHTHITFRHRPDKKPSGQKEKGFAVDIGMIYSVAVPVVIQHGELTGEIRIAGVDKDATTEKNLVVNFERTGNSEGRGHLKVFRKTPEGLERITHGFNPRIYREANTDTSSVRLLEGKKPEGDLLLRLLENDNRDARILQEMEVSL